MVEPLESQSMDEVEINNNFEVLTGSTKVHTKGTDLNEDATLSDLSVSFSRLAEWVASNIHIIGILRSYMKSDSNFVRRSNYLNEWGKKITYKTPTKRSFEQVKRLLLNHVQARLILSRSNKGAPLKAFLTYGRDVTNAQLGVEEKRTLKDRLLGKKEEQGI